MLEEKIRCAYCKNKNNVSNDFCSYCGAPLPDVVPAPLNVPWVGGVSGSYGYISNYPSYSCTGSYSSSVFMRTIQGDN